MATIAHTIDAIKTYGDRAHVVSWALLTAANEVGNAVEMTGSADRSVQIIGTFDSATVVIQGSNDGTNWASLTDPQGNAISKTAAALEAISELTRYVRPLTSGGGGSQSLTVLLLVKR